MKLVKVIFDFGYHIATKQDDIVMRLPIEQVPKASNEVTFTFELSEEVDELLFIVAEIQYVYNRNSIAHIKIYLKSADD